MIDSTAIVAHHLQLRLEAIGINTNRPSSNALNFVAGDYRYGIWCADGHAAVYDLFGVYGDYMYANPNFYDNIIKTVRAIVKPTPILHVTNTESITVPSILDE